ncbi:MAG: hypothetical protein O7C61_00075 [SAR324 cluster bacterium]|nr:hypothetical protein [SAR324 cluster bacterium]
MRADIQEIRNDLSGKAAQGFISLAMLEAMQFPGPQAGGSFPGQGAPAGAHFTQTSVILTD